MVKITPFNKLKTTVKQRQYVLLTSVLLLIIISSALMIYLNTGIRKDAQAALGNNMGFENYLSEWTTVSGTWAPSIADKRTGVRSALCSATTTEAKLRNSSSNITIPNTGVNFITVIAYAKASSTAGRARVGVLNTNTNIESLPLTFTSLSTGGYTMLTFHFAAVNGHTYIPVLSAQTSSGTASIYFDDVIIYTSTATAADLTNPGKGQTFSATTSGTQINMSWTNGSDSESGVGGVLILRTPGLSTASASPVNQVTYHPTSPSIGPTVVSGFNVIYNGNTISSINNNPGTTGSFTYLIFTRDRAYNYSSSPMRLYVINGTSLSNTLASNITLDGLFIAGACTLNINYGNALTFADNAVGNIHGYINSTGRIISGSGVNVAMKNGSTYEYSRETPSGETTPILQANWEPGSTCLITGVKSVFPSGFNQTFHHLTWNCSMQLNDFQFPANQTIKGNLRILDTSPGASNRSFCFNGNCTIEGDLQLVNGTAMAKCNTGSRIIMKGSTAQQITGSFTFEELEIDNGSGVMINNNQIINNALFLTNGDFDLNNRTIQMVHNSLISRDGGSVSNGIVDIFNPGVASNRYNLRYRAGCTTGIELMSSSTRLNNLTIQTPTNQEVVLNKHAVVNGTLTLTSGKVVTGSYEVRVIPTTAASVSYTANSFVEGNLRRNIANTGSVIYDFPVGYDDKQQVAIITANALTGTNSLVASFSPNITGAAPNPSTCKIGASGISTLLNHGIWTIEPNTQPTGGNYSITLKAQGYTNGISNVLGYCVIKRNDASSPWQSVGVHSNLTQSLISGILSVTRSSLTSFSDFGVGYGSGFSLPISLSSFDVTQHETNKVKITWVTASELNNAYFSLERSANGIDFEMINEQEGAGTSTVASSYQYIDKNPLPGINYYRLKQVDFDGTFTYGPVKKISLSQTANNENPLLNITVYPNPTTGVINIKNISTLNHLITIKIYDVSGQLIKQLSSNMGDNLQVDLTGHTPGIYMLNFTDQNNHSFNKQIVLQP